MPRGKKNAPAKGEFDALMRAFAFGQKPDVDAEGFLAEHPGMMDALVQAGRDNGFTPNAVVELSPEEFQDGGDHSDVGSRLELAGFLEVATERCELTALPDMVDAESPAPNALRKPAKKRGRRKSTKPRKAKKVRRTKKSKGAGVHANPNSVTQRVLAVLKDAPTARRMKEEAGSISKLLVVLQTKHGIYELTNGNLFSILYKTLKIAKKG